jgi:hypothetical protein
MTRAIQVGMMDIVAPGAETSLYNHMLRDHHHLEDEYCRLLEAIEVDAPTVRELWTELEHGLLAHMEAEERYMLPAFATVDRVEALALLREHGQIRELLLELGVAIDLHLLRFERSKEFIAALRAHASREDKLLYRWADKHLTSTQAAAAISFAGRPR